MLIASKDKNQIINADHAMAVFANNENRVIVASSQGRNMVLDDYDTRKESLKAVEILIDRIRMATEKTTIVFMPTDEEVERALTGSREHYRHMDGRKTKGHGGS